MKKIRKQESLRNTSGFLTTFDTPLDRNPKNSPLMTQIDFGAGQRQRLEQQLRGSEQKVNLRLKKPLTHVPWVTIGHVLLPLFIHKGASPSEYCEAFLAAENGISPVE